MNSKSTKYNVNDVVYIVEEFRVVKSIIDSIIITKDNSGERISYITYAYKDKNIKPKKRQYSEAMIVDNLETARQSALANWRTITQDVKKQLEKLTDKDFEPINS